MKQFMIFIRKEFAHVFRDRKTLLMLFGLPIAQIILFGFALSNEVKNSRIVVVDYAKDEASERLIRKIEASSYFETERSLKSAAEIETLFRSGKIRMAIVFPDGFHHDLVHSGKAQLQVIADASDPNLATTLTSYINAIVRDYMQEENATASLPFAIIPEVKMLYNPELRGAPNFVPGVMSLILMLVCVMMTSISIVREKEMGTMEVLLVSPFRPLLVIISKAVPYLILSIVNVIIILLLSIYVLNVPVAGSMLLLLAESILFIITALSLGILISTRTSSQQSAMMISLMAMMLPTMLFTGFMFPIENMPLPLRIISHIVPSRWYYIIVKAIMIKGLGIASIWKETVILFGMTVFFLALSLKNFKIRLA
jgi:ABC-2 type transport system permease protein